MCDNNEFVIMDGDDHAFMYGEWVDVVEITDNSIHRDIPQDGIFDRPFKIISLEDARNRIEKKNFKKLLTLYMKLKEVKNYLNKWSPLERTWEDTYIRIYNIDKDIHYIKRFINLDKSYMECLHEAFYE